MYLRYERGRRRSAGSLDRIDWEQNPGMELVWPSAHCLASYVHALEQGWSPDNLRPEAAGEELARIAHDPALFLAEQVDLDAKGPPVRLPNGATAARLPGYHRWMWHGEFCGVIGIRWQPGTEALPPHCLGHIGYSVVPWKRRRGYATSALRLLLPEVKPIGLKYVELTSDVTNIASRRIIEANGGAVVARFSKPADYGGEESLRFRISIQ